jgi:hypothetical protein
MLRVWNQAKQVAHSGPPLALAFPRGSHSATLDPEQKITKGPQISRRYLKQTRLQQDCTTQKGESCSALSLVHSKAGCQWLQKPR